MRYTLDQGPAAPDFKALVNILDRTGSFDWEALDIGVAVPSIADCLEWPTAEIDAVAAGLGQIKARLAAGFPAGATEGAAAEPPAQAGWIRASAIAMAPFPQIEQRAETRAAQLGALVDHDTILRATQLYAGRIKDGAIDARLLSGAYGWFIVSTVLDGLRQEVQALQPREAEALLAPFSPLLVLLGRVMEERDAQAKKSRSETDALAAEVQLAQAERDEAEAQLKLRGTPSGLPLDTLAEMAKKGGAPEAPRPPGRTRRTRR